MDLYALERVRINNAGFRVCFEILPGMLPKVYADTRAYARGGVKKNP